MNQAPAPGWDQLTHCKGLQDHKVVTEGWCCHRVRGMELDEEVAVTKKVLEEGGRRGWALEGGEEQRSY